MHENSHQFVSFDGSPLGMDESFEHIQRMRPYLLFGLIVGRP